MQIFARLAVLMVAMPLAGCFTAEQPLYASQKPVTPLHSGAVDVRDPAHPDARDNARLELGRDGVYRLTGGGQDTKEVTRFRLYPLGSLLVAETAVCKNGDTGCGPGRNYVLVRVMAGRVEWRTPDCSLALSKLSGIRVKTDDCQFYDLAALQKALRIAAAAPWKADGAYIPR